ncbi:hypothetical protein [Helicobacter sp. 23-1045]
MSFGTICSGVVIRVVLAQNVAQWTPKSYFAHFAPKQRKALLPLLRLFVYKFFVILSEAKNLKNNRNSSQTKFAHNDKIITKSNP